MTQPIIPLMWPELTLVIAAAVVLLVGLGRLGADRKLTAWLALAGIVIAFLITWYAGMPDRPLRAPGIRVTNLVWYVRIVALGIGLLVVLVNWPTLFGPPPREQGEHFAMILFSLAGILLTALADDLVLLFLAVELVSVPTYVLVAVGRGDIRAQEAGLKYFFLGALSAALMVYGFSFLYGASGTTTLSTMNLSRGSGGYAALGLLLAFAGFAYKIAAVPFHVYAADVYQGAASPVTGLLGFFPKLAGFIALIKLLLLVQPPGAPASGWDLPPVAFAFLWVAAAATMTVGNVLGLMQHNVKRILAYSSIAHSGYMLVGLLAGPVTGAGPLPDGVSAMLFYIVVYGMMNLGAFAILALVESRGRPAEDLEDIVGLGYRHPLAGLGLAVCIFSLIGMPPTAGFFGKVYVFGAALSAGPDNPHQQALIWLAVIGFVNAAVAAAYYLRIIAACYLREAEPQPAVIPQSRGVRASVLGCALLILIIGLWPAGLIRMARQTFFDLRPAEPRFVQHATPPPPAQPSPDT